jgi:hypothetical protein
VEFARWQPVHVRLDDGHVELTLRFRSLTMGRNTWNDFEVSTRFAPQVQGREISLTRDNFIEIRGARLGFRDRLPLRGIFTALFTKERTFPLVNEAMWEDTRWEEIQVTQSLIRDGWWGVAYGSSTLVAQQPARLSQQTTPGAFPMRVIDLPAKGGDVLRAGEGARASTDPGRGRVLAALEPGQLNLGS